MTEMIRGTHGLFIAVITFTIGTFWANFAITHTTLERITSDIGTFENRWVEVETYAQIDEVLGWTIGEPFEKKERLTFIEDQLSELNDIRDEMVSATSNDSYPRIKVRVRGLVEDNCNNGIPCCYGETMTLKQASITVLNQPEVYSRPKFE